MVVCVPPGSGKSAVLLEASMEHCAHMQVLIVCPTGYLVNQYKSKLPDVPGAENVRIDTIQGVAVTYKHMYIYIHMSISSAPVVLFYFSLVVRYPE